MLDHFKDRQNIHDVLHEAQTGLWAIEIDEGKLPRMYADSVMLELLGLDHHPSPEGCYRYWFDHIEDEYYSLVQNAVERVSRDERSEVQYLWQHPVWGRLYVRCGGVRDWNYKEGLCIRGYHQNITNTVSLKQEYDTVIQTLSETYSLILLCNLENQNYSKIKITDRFRQMSSGILNYEEAFYIYIAEGASVQYKQVVFGTVNSFHIQQKLAQGEKQLEVFFRNVHDGWSHLRIVPAAGYSEEYPWVIVALDEKDGEMEKRFDDATALAAVGQIYKLVISVDLNQSEYSCIHYSGELLKLKRHGEYMDFYNQVKLCMPLEDRLEFDRMLAKESYKDREYLEGTLRMFDGEGILHYYSYYSTRIWQGPEERILLTVRNADDKQEEQKRENTLANLCRSYYSIYLFDLEHDIEEAIWQEDMIDRRTVFSKGSLAAYYEKFIRDYVFGEDQEKMRRAGNPDFLRHTLSAEQPVYDIDFRRVYPEGLLWVRSRFSIAEIRDGQIVKVVFANMNINEQKIEELEEEQKKKQYFEYQNIIRGLSAFYHSVFYVDLTEETFQGFNLRQDITHLLRDRNEYKDLMWVYKDNLIQEEDRERFTVELSIGEIRRRITEGDTIYALEFRRDYGGYYGWMRMHIILAESRNGIPLKIVLAAHNVEEEKEAEEQKQKALLEAYEAAKTANEAKSNFLAQMSHDIRTPINAIIGMTSIAKANVDDTERVMDCLGKISMSSTHLLSLINEILDMSKIEKGRLDLAEESFSLDEMMQGINSIIRLEALEKAHDIQFRTVDLIHDRLIGDANRIRQVLINLIGNAVKYTPEPGQIRITVQEVSPQAPGTGCFVFTVEDNGIGIDKKFLDYIFVPFTRADDIEVRRVQGTGLGMSIAKGIVSAMHGSIQVESEKGKGSLFMVTLNLKISEIIQQDELKPNEARPLELEKTEDFGFPGGRRILLVEDNALNMEIARTILEINGLTVDGAANGCEALQKFTESVPGTYEAILMDVQMPVMDGYTASREIRGSRHTQAASIPIIALTANAFAEDIARALASGMNDHVSKPIDFERLMGVLKKNIGYRTEKEKNFYE